MKKIADLDRFALTLVLTGVGLLAVHLALFRGDEEPVNLALVAFFICEVGGVVCGILARRSLVGRVACCLGAGCLLASLFLAA